jgi:hypothetical protein
MPLKVQRPVQKDRSRDQKYHDPAAFDEAETFNRTQGQAGEDLKDKKASWDWGVWILVVK